MNEAKNCHHYQLAELAKVDEKNKEVAGLLDTAIQTSNNLTNDAKVKMNNMAAFTTDLTSAIAQSSAAIEEMLASIRSIHQISDSRRPLLSQMQLGFAQVGENLDNTVKAVNTIESSVAAVEEMNKLITDVADRTNLLSMNAAIEAARAGETGKGFAVVAGEIRKLAEASASNANKISRSLKEITASVNTSVEVSKDSQSQAGSISGVVTSVQSSFDEISNGVSELSLGSKEISEALGVMTTSSRDIESLYLEVQKVMENMMDMILNMESLLGQLTHK
jgi:methyl-accepting chemotaxis protein